MPVCPGPPYPATAYHSVARPANYGFMAHYINEVKDQVYSEMRQERVRRLSAQKGCHSSYGQRPRYAGPYYTPPSKKSSTSSGSSATRLVFPTPQIPSYPTTPSPAFPTPHSVSPTSIKPTQTRPERRVRFPSPQPYDLDTPVSLYSMPVPVPAPYTPPDDLVNMTPPTAYQTPPQVMPFPDTDESTPLPSRPLPTPSVFGSSTASTYGNSSYRSSRSSVSSSSRVRPSLRPRPVPAPSVFGSSSTSSQGDSTYCSCSSCYSSSSSVSSKGGRVNYDPLRKAAENMEVLRQLSAGWMNIIRQNRPEKMNMKEKEVTSLIKELHEKAFAAHQAALAIPNMTHSDRGYLHSAKSTSQKLSTEVSTLAALGTALQQKFASVLHRLRNARATGHAPEPGCCARIMNAPGCLAGLYLKRRLFHFSSLLKANKDQYSDLDSQASIHLPPGRLPMTTLLSLLYNEVRRTYGSASKALAGFETSVHAFSLQIQPGHAASYYRH